MRVRCHKQRRLRLGAYVVSKKPRETDSKSLASERPRTSEEVRHRRELRSGSERVSEDLTRMDARMLPEYRFGMLKEN